MLIEHQHPSNKSIMVGVLGAPNVGKSSLVNYLMGYELSVVTNRPQTTRNKFHCVFTVDHTEIILVDTPGLHKSNVEFNKRLNQQAIDGLNGTDLNLLLIDLNRELYGQFEDFKSHINKELGRTWVCFTKADLVKNAEQLPLEGLIEKAKELIPSIEKHFIISSKTELNTNKLIGAICDVAQSGPHLYNKNRMSNKNMRFFVTEYIREQAFELLKDEIPYETAVVIDDYTDFTRKEDDPKIKSKISASILVNRPSQRAIVVGSKGSMIKNIGVNARKRIEDLLGGQILLNLHVKVAPKWFKNNMILEELGLPRAENSNRVWRQR